jgi:hypothetical protein
MAKTLLLMKKLYISKMEEEKTIVDFVHNLKKITSLQIVG